MIHPKDASSFKAMARIEYVELTYMGQAFRTMRYDEIIDNFCCVCFISSMYFCQ